MKTITDDDIRAAIKDAGWLVKGLREVADSDLPAEGFLAGGSVAALLFRRFWGGDYPVNDLDIFMEHEGPYSFDVRTPYRELKGRQMFEEYPTGLRLGKHGYRVVSTSREGMLNRVKVSCSPNHNFGRLVLEGFDLNCCQAGLDLATGGLVITREFADFLKKGQLLVTNAATPSHTMVRMAKKKEEYGCYCDLQTEASLLATAGEVLGKARGHNRSNIRYAPCFGVKYRDLWQSHRSALEGLCSLSRLDGERELYTLEYKVPDAKDAMRELFRGKWKKLNNQNIVKAFDLHCRPTTSVAVRKRFREAAVSGKINLESAMHQKEYLTCPMVSQGRLKMLDSFLQEHPAIWKLFHSYDLNQQQQVEAMELIRKKVEEQSVILLGMLEAMAEELRRNAPTLKDYISLVEEMYLRQFPKGEIVPPLDLSGFHGNRMVRELTTGKALTDEGRRMNHCVGGYFPELARHNGKYRIFHIEDNNGRSTVAMRNGRIVEHRGISNSAPAPEHTKTAQELAAFIPWDDFNSPYSEYTWFPDGDIPF